MTEVKIGARDPLCIEADDPAFYDAVSLSFPSAMRVVNFRGLIKREPKEFYVEELYEPQFSGAGEHVWLWVQKEGQNSEYVAKQIAKYAGVRSMDVGLSGQKDRWAVTRQWFSVYLGNRPNPDWNEFKFEGVSVLRSERHNKKLRKGEHLGNRFRIVVSSDNSDEDKIGTILSSELERSLSNIKQRGFPNYFGMQRFGRGGANLVRAAKWFAGEIKVSRSQRSFYLSAARSYLFNLNLASQVKDSGWQQEDAAGPMYGDPVEGVKPLDEQEQGLLDKHPLLAKGIHQNRLKLERRPYCVKPENMSWQIAEDKVKINFDLPVGCFATALLSELMIFRDAQAIE